MGLGWVFEVLDLWGFVGCVGTFSKSRLLSAYLFKKFLPNLDYASIALA